MWGSGWVCSTLKGTPSPTLSLPYKDPLFAPAWVKLCPPGPCLFATHLGFKTAQRLCPAFRASAQGPWLQQPLQVAQGGLRG